MKELELSKQWLVNGLGLLSSGQVEQAESYLKEAERILRAAIAQYSSNAELHFTLARLLESRERFGEADSQYAVAQALEPDDVRIQSAYRALLLRRQAANPVETEPDAAAERNEGKMETMRELMLDGNAVAGLLHNIFDMEMTEQPLQCAHCGQRGEIGRLLAFTQAPGVVLRCPSCENIVLRIVETDHAFYLDARGAVYLRLEKRVA